MKKWLQAFSQDKGLSADRGKL
ncbi:hypothetical protein E2320_003920, partial [Naja naja]